MSNTLHIVQGSTAKRTLKIALQESGENEKILAFTDDLKYGPIFKDFSDKELQKRSLYLERLFGKYDEYYHPKLHDFVNYDFDKYEKIVVWHGNNVEELLLLYMACSLIKGNMYDINIEEIKNNFPHLPEIPFTLPLTCCNVENIKLLYNKIKPISNERKQEYRSLWERWSKSDAPIRIIDSKNNLIEVEEDYFDEVLLSNCTLEYEAVARAIGETLCDTNFLIGDSFLHKRVISLITQNKLSSCNNEEFSTEIEVSNRSDKTKIVINGVNVTQLRFFSVRLNSH